MIIQEFTVADGQVEATFRVQRNVQNLIVKRVSTLAILGVGLLLGLPEKVSAEITHPVRKRVTLADRQPLSDIAAWGQYKRGPIVEQAPAASLADPLFGEVRGGISTAQQITTQVNYYLNQDGPLEITESDQLTVTITGLVAGAHYTISVPDLPLMPLASQQFYKYEQSLILAGDREKNLFTAAACGLILPNRSAAIERIIITYQLDADTTKDCEYSLDELLAMQADANPFVSIMNYTSPQISARSTAVAPSGFSDLLVLSLNHVRNVEIHTVLGQELSYTLVKVDNRNDA